MIRIKLGNMYLSYFSLDEGCTSNEFISELKFSFMPRYDGIYEFKTIEDAKIMGNKIKKVLGIEDNSISLINTIDEDKQKEFDDFFNEE